MNENQSPIEPLKVVDSTKEKSESQIKQTRKNLQLARRGVHMGAGITIAIIYHFMLTHQRAIYILGAIACILYVAEQIRINYPELSEHFEMISKYIFRAEEQLKESAGIPYVMGILLCIISFPKPIALVSILTLAISDPLSAIIGINYGKTHIVKEKSVEGSLAFFIATFLAGILVFSYFFGMNGKIVFLCFISSLCVSSFEMVPLRIDDNLTIPIFSSFSLWLWCTILSIPV